MLEQRDQKMIAILPITGEATESSSLKYLLDLQLKMATSSINHEYARLEYDDKGVAHERREELLEYMQNCHQVYCEAREKLQNFDPYALDEFERDLMLQKQQTFSENETRKFDA